VTPRTPSLDQVARFRRDLDALAAPIPLGVAVSGGPDSIALLLLARSACKDNIRAATIDHGLRPESMAEAAFVADICARLGVPHDTLHVAPGRKGASLQSRARAQRYGALAAWARDRGIPAIATAHHIEDQAETLVMRLARGSGVSGLAAVRARSPVPGAQSPASQLIRPLLSWRRAELAAIVEAARISPVQDPSNADERFDRARIRRRLAENSWLDPVPFARSAAALADADDALEWVAVDLAAKRIARHDAFISLQPGGIPAELRRRLVLRCLRIVAPDAAPRGEALTALLGDLSAGQTATLAGVKCIGGECWTFTPAPPRRTKPAASS